MRDDTPSKGQPKQVGVATFITDKIHFKPRKVRRAKDEHYIIIKEIILQEYMIFINIYTANPPDLQVLHPLIQLTADQKKFRTQFQRSKKQI